MKLIELKDFIDKAYENAENLDVDVEIWHGDTMYDIVDIRQFRVIPTVVISIEEA